MLVVYVQQGVADGLPEIGCSLRVFGAFDVNQATFVHDVGVCAAYLKAAYSKGGPELWPVQDKVVPCYFHQPSDIVHELLFQFASA